MARTQWFWTGSGLRRVKPYVQCGGILRGKRSPLELNSRPPYMSGGLGFPFEVGGHSLGSVTYFGKLAFRNYKEDLVILRSTGGASAVI
jgi:hypothetical protein